MDINDIERASVMKTDMEQWKEMLVRIRNFITRVQRERNEDITDKPYKLFEVNVPYEWRDTIPIEKSIFKMNYKQFQEFCGFIETIIEQKRIELLDLIGGEK